MTIPDEVVKEIEAFDRYDYDIEWVKSIALLTRRLTIEEMVELCNQHIASALAAGMETGSIELVRNAAIRQLEGK